MPLLAAALQQNFKGYQEPLLSYFKKDIELPISAVATTATTNKVQAFESLANLCTYQKVEMQEHAIEIG